MSASRRQYRAGVTALAVALLMSACTTDGTPRYPGSVADAVKDLKSSSREETRRDVGYWLRDRIALEGTPLTESGDEGLALMKALCDWAVYDIRPPVAGAVKPDEFADHEFLMPNVDGRPGVAIAADYGKQQRLSSIQPRDFTHYYAMEKMEVHPMTPRERGHVQALFRVGSLTKFEQATFHGARIGDVASVQLQIGLGTEHQLWLMEDGEWRFLHRINQWVG